VKEKVLGVINVAKTVFKGGDDAAKKELGQAVAATSLALKELFVTFESGVNGARAAPAHDDDLDIDDDEPEQLSPTSPTSDIRSHEAPAKTTTRKENSPLPVHKRSASESSAKLASSTPANAAAAVRRPPPNPCLYNRVNSLLTLPSIQPKPQSDALSPKDASKQLQKEFSSRDPEKVFKVQELLGEGHAKRHSFLLCRFLKKLPLLQS